MAGPSRRKELFIPPYVHPHNMITFPREAKQICEGDFVMLEGRPCKTIGPLPSKDRHGNFELHFIGYDIFHNIRYEQNAPPSSMMDVPCVTLKEWQLEDIELDPDKTYLTIPTIAKLLNPENGIRKYVKIPEFGMMGDKIRAEHANENKGTLICTVTSSCWEEHITEIRTKE